MMTVFKPTPPPTFYLCLVF